MTIQSLFSSLLPRPEPTPISQVVDDLQATLMRRQRPGSVTMTFTAPSTSTPSKIAPVPPEVVEPATTEVPRQANPSASATTRSGERFGLPSPRRNPWQRQGVTLLAEATTDPALAIRKAGLDWQVERVDLRTADTLEPVPSVSAIRRMDTQAILGVVGPDFTPLQNHQMFDLFRDLGRAGPDDGSVPFTIETAGSLQGGAVTWALAHLPDLGIRIGDDQAKTYLLISNGHTGNKVLTVAPTTIRVVCQNTLRLAEAQVQGNRNRPGLAGGFQVRHTPGLQEALREIRAAYAATIASHRLTQQAWQHLASRPLTAKLQADFLAEVFGRPGPDEADRARALRQAREERLAAILASPTSQVRGTKDSAFSLLQAVVEYVDHDRPTRTATGADPDENRLFSATFGSGSDLKARAWSSILEVAR